MQCNLSNLQMCNSVLSSLYEFQLKKKVNNNNERNKTEKENGQETHNFPYIQRIFKNEPHKTDQVSNLQLYICISKHYPVHRLNQGTIKKKNSE